MEETLENKPFDDAIEILMSYNEVSLVTNSHFHPDVCYILVVCVHGMGIFVQ